MPPSTFLGAAVLLGADIATRVIPTHTELKLGMLTSLLGAPFFFWLIARNAGARLGRRSADPVGRRAHLGP